MLCTSVLDFVRVEVSRGAQLLELVCRSYSEFGQVMTLAEEQAVLEIASGEPPAKAWLIRCKGELIGYFILALTFSLRCRGRGAALDQIYLTPELRQRVLCRVIEFVEYQAALVGATMLDVKFTFKANVSPLHSSALVSKRDTHL